MTLVAIDDLRIGDLYLWATGPKPGDRWRVVLLKRENDLFHFIFNDGEVWAYDRAEIHNTMHLVE